MLITRAGIDDIGGACWRSDLQEGEAVHLRHVDVDDQQVERLAQQLLQRLDAVQRLVDLEAGAFQRVAVEAAHQAGIVDDQDALARRLSHRAPPARPLVDDGIGEAADLEKRRDAAHGFGVPQADEAARRQVLEEVLGRHAPGGVIEVDQHVSAEDDIESAMRAGFGRIDEVDRGELHRLAQVVDDVPAVLAGRHEVLLDQVGRQPHQRALAEYALRAAAVTHWVSMSEPTISMSWTSTSGQFSSSQMAIE